MRRFPATALVPALFLAVGFSAALRADDSLRSGPQPGEMIPGPFHYFNATGVHAGKPHCLVCEYGLRPVVMVFSREVPDAGAAQALVTLLQKLDEAVGRHQQARLRSCAVFLSNDAANEDATREVGKKLEDVAKSADLKNVVVAVGGPSGPEGYHIGKDAGVTVVLYQRHKVVANFAFAKGKMTDKDVDAVLSAVKDLVAVKK